MHSGGAFLYIVSPSVVGIQLVGDCLGAQPWPRPPPTAPVKARVEEWRLTGRPANTSREAKLEQAPDTMPAAGGARRGSSSREVLPPHQQAWGRCSKKLS